MKTKHGNFTPLETKLGKGKMAEPRFKGTAQLVKRGRPCTYRLRVFDTRTNKIVLEKNITANPDGGTDTAIMKAHDLARTFEPNVFKSKNFKK